MFRNKNWAIKSHLRIPSSVRHFWHLDYKHRRWKPFSSGHSKIGVGIPQRVTLWHLPYIAITMSFLRVPIKKNTPFMDLVDVPFSPVFPPCLNTLIVGAFCVIVNFIFRLLHVWTMGIMLHMRRMLYWWLETTSCWTTLTIFGRMSNESCNNNKKTERNINIFSSNTNRLWLKSTGFAVCWMDK